MVILVGDVSVTWPFGVIEIYTSAKGDLDDDLM